LPHIIEELNFGGVHDKDITIILGLGNHRKHTMDEIRQLVGYSIYHRITCVDHDINDCVNLGESTRGTPIEVFKRVVEADFIIGTGNIEFHYSAGYSGGNKALMPGVCSKNTIQNNHKMMTDPNARSGKAEGNPMREDIEEIGSKSGMKFIFNVILNEKKEIVYAVSGNPIDAHRNGADFLDKMYKWEIDEQADIVIASVGGYPKDINLYQAQKGLEHASLGVKEGGIIILVAECSEDLGEELFHDWMIRASSPEEPIRWIQEEFILGAHKAAAVSMVLLDKTVFLVSRMEPTLVKDIFLTPFSTIQDALDKAMELKGLEGSIIVMPAAGSTLPYIHK
jgi:nickel-dependent lactate racemase